MSKTLLYAVVLALSTPVFAAESEQTTPADDAHAQFMKIDANHDGVIDRKEAKGDTNPSANSPRTASWMKKATTPGKIH